MLCTRKPLQGWMSIVYSLVARGTVVLAEYVLGDYVGNFSAVNNLLSKLEAEANIPETGSFTFESKDPDRGTSRKFAFHYLHKSHLIFVALCDLTFSRQNVFLFLNHIHSEFVGTFRERVMSAPAYSLDKDFKYTLAEQMRAANAASAPTSAAVGRVQSQIQDVRTVLIENVDLVLARGEKIDDLLDKSEVLHEHATVFERKSTQLRRRFCCESWRMTILIVVVVLILAYAGTAIGCGGFDVPKCR